VEEVRGVFGCEVKEECVGEGSTWVKRHEVVRKVRCVCGVKREEGVGKVRVVRG
jgi:hypothetical protein